MAQVAEVPLLDLTRVDPAVEAELEEASRRVLRSGRFILGPEVEGLEAECARYIGTKHAITVSSGTDALLAALMALGVGPGDEVVCPTYTFFATAGSVWRIGARVVFADSLPGSFNCDPDDIARKLGPCTKAVIPVHLFGQCADMDPILEAARRHGAAVIEDAAQAIGAAYRGRAAGTMGALNCFSFFPSKNLAGFGDGGLVTTDDDALADQVRILRVHGMEPKYHHRFVGANFRLDALQAALLRVRLRHLDAATAARQRNAALYLRLLTEAGVAAPNPHSRGPREAAVQGSGAEEAPIWLPAVLQERHTFNQFALRVRGRGVRDKLRGFLAEARIGTEVYYPVPLHLQECFRTLGHRRGEFPVAEALAEEMLAVPIFPELREEEIGYVCERIGAFFR
jgi:dTDP-4-amino-4,6-dideoxygalactose transaminase